MPLYDVRNPPHQSNIFTNNVQVRHAIPLTDDQKTRLAEYITDLHAKTFNTLTFFVTVIFTSTESNDNVFIAGKKHKPANIISASVRMSEARTKEDFDKMAAKIENAWNDIVGLDTSPHVLTEEEKMLKMHMVGFVAIITVRENGVPVPTVSLHLFIPYV